MTRPSISAWSTRTSLSGGIGSSSGSNLRNLDQTDEAERPITFRDLLAHRSGLTYGDFHRGPSGRAHAETLGPTIDNPLTPDAWISRLGTLPLIDLLRCRGGVGTIGLPGRVRRLVAGRSE